MDKMLSTVAVDKKNHHVRDGLLQLLSYISCQFAATDRILYCPRCEQDTGYCMQYNGLISEESPLKVGGFFTDEFQGISYRPKFTMHYQNGLIPW